MSERPGRFGRPRSPGSPISAGARGTRRGESGKSRRAHPRRPRRPTRLGRSADSYSTRWTKAAARGLRSLHATALEQVDQPAALGGSAERLRASSARPAFRRSSGPRSSTRTHRLGHEMPVAAVVRLGEDGEAASFAGMYDTYTNVVGDEALLERLVDCWVALFANGVIAYRSTCAPQGEPAIAVVVQQLVDAECAA